MYNTPITRILCVLDGYLEIIDSYRKGFIMDINQDFYLARKDSDFFIRRNPASLHNLKSDLSKALQILNQMKNALRNRNSGKNDIHSLEVLLRQHAFDFYRNDCDELLFAESVICNTIELVQDDEQFSEFSYF